MNTNKDTEQRNGLTCYQSMNGGLLELLVQAGQFSVGTQTARATTCSKPERQLITRGGGYPSTS